MSGTSAPASGAPTMHTVGVAFKPYPVMLEDVDGLGIPGFEWARQYYLKGMTHWRVKLSEACPSPCGCKVINVKAPGENNLTVVNQEALKRVRPKPWSVRVVVAGWLWGVGVRTRTHQQTHLMRKHAHTRHSTPPATVPRDAEVSHEAGCR